MSVSYLTREAATQTDDVVTVDFHGDSLEAVQRGPNREDIYVSVRRVCEGLGLDHSSQRAKLRNKSWATVVMITSVAADGKPREQAFLRLDRVPMWLANIDERRVSPEIRPKLVRYQVECADALARHFFKGDPNNVFDALRRSIDQIEANSRAVQQLGTALSVQANRLTTVEQTAEAAWDHATSNYGWYTVMGWMSLLKKKVEIAEAAKIGRQLTAICKAREIELGWQMDPRFGRVNTYPEEILKEVLGSPFTKS